MCHYNLAGFILRLSKEARECETNSYDKSATMCLAVITAISYHGVIILLSILQDHPKKHGDLRQTSKTRVL